SDISISDFRIEKAWVYPGFFLRAAHPANMSESFSILNPKTNEDFRLCLQETGLTGRHQFAGASITPAVTGSENPANKPNVQFLNRPRLGFIAQPPAFFQRSSAGCEVPLAVPFAGSVAVSEVDWPEFSR
ncbi:MAG: hypothetical protein AAB250_17165, partial [Bdellovibrionota bacterium]